MKWIMGLVWQVLGKFPNGQTPWNSVENHPDDPESHPKR